MAVDVTQIRGLLIPLQGSRLVVPNSLVVQILSDVAITSLSGAPTWMMGTVIWQRRIIPALSFELVSNRQYQLPENPMALVLKSINKIESLPFYAIMLSGIPHPKQLNDENISAVEHAHSSSPFILNEVLVDGEPTSIPNLDALEEMLAKQYGKLVDEEEFF